MLTWLRECRQWIRQFTIVVRDAWRLGAELQRWKQPPPSQLYRADDLPESIRGNQGLGLGNGSVILDPRAPLYAFHSRQQAKLREYLNNPQARITTMSNEVIFPLRRDVKLYPKKTDVERFVSKAYSVLPPNSAYTDCSQRAFMLWGLFQQKSWEQVPVALCSGPTRWDSVGHAYLGFVCLEGAFFYDPFLAQWFPDDTMDFIVRNKLFWM